MLTDLQTSPDPESVVAARPISELKPRRAEFFASYDDIRGFILREWERKLDYRMKRETWTYEGDRVTVGFEYEWRDAGTGGWLRSHGAEVWIIGPDGLLRCADRQISDVPLPGA